jgi:lipopolysaccharide transport system ATP-binding protein
MAEPAIRVEALGKSYDLASAGTRPGSLREAIARAITVPWRHLQVRRGRRGTSGDSFWALRDVSFAVAPGEVVGVIGRNGAGKSTLLKVLSRITEPTSGRAVLYGRVGSLLEVGTGFHPELTGRENIFLSGAILGMRRTDIIRRFDEIVSFAEVERFLDTPIKRYSSGMYVRLAFAVAAHLEADILLVDEVLAVGDAAFQRKSLGKMSSMTQEGRTVLFVSHNLLAVEGLCPRALWLHDGELRQDGEAASVVAGYLGSFQALGCDCCWPEPETAPGVEGVRLRRVAIVTEGPGGARVDRAARLIVELWNRKPGARLTVTLHVLSAEGVVAFCTSTLHSETQWEGKPFPVGLYRCQCLVPPRLLNASTYRVAVLVVEDQARILFRHDDALVFTVSESAGERGAYYGARPGVLAPRLSWSTEKVEEVSP